ncbi:hypothetical protein [Ideonella sp.]|uniref:hypothetical protein n=1 Tax=Ideonella sp. TaxID=1929293 RepID=UPI003BB7D7B2
MNDVNAKYRSVATLIFEGNYPPPGKYIVRYQGQGQIEHRGAGEKVKAESRPGRHVVLLRPSDKVAYWIELTAIQSDNPIRDIQIIPPGGICKNQPLLTVDSVANCNDASDTFISFEELADKQRFHPALLRDATGFRTLRFMDWGNTNANPLARWADRPQLSDRTWASPKGVPLEVMFELANKAAATPWINLPADADDNYVREFARLARKQLSEQSNLILEYSNEPWNQAFAVAKTLAERGKALWPNANASAAVLRHNAYARRSAQICLLAKAEFGNQAHRVQCVVNAQAAVATNTDLMLNCALARSELGKPCSAYFDAVAIAPYFAGYIGNLAFRTEVQRWLQEPDRGTSKLFEEVFGHDTEGKRITPPLASVGSKAPGGALALAKDWTHSSKKVADLHKLPLWAYEGGQHLAMHPGDSSDAFFSLMKAANRDERMVLAYDQMLRNWSAEGGQIFAYYNHIGGVKKWGSFGLKEGPFDDSAPKWRAVSRQRDQVKCWWSKC